MFEQRIIILLKCGATPKEGEYGVSFEHQDYSAIKTVQNGDYYVTEDRFFSIEAAQEWLDTHTLNDFFCFGQLSVM